MSFNEAETRRRLESPDEEVRLAAIRNMEDVQDTRALRFLTVGLGDASWRVRKEASRLMIDWPRPVEAAETSILCLYASENAGLRNSAVSVLQALGAQIVDVLCEAMEEADEEVAKFICDVLGDIGSAKAVESIVALLDAEDINLRQSAVESLGKIATPETINIVWNRLESGDDQVKFTALEAIANSGDLSRGRDLGLIFDCLDRPILRKAGYDALKAAADASSLPYLAGGLTADNKTARGAAALALDNLIRRGGISEAEVRDKLAASPKVAGYLVESLNERDKSIAHSAAALLGIIGAADHAADVLRLAKLSADNDWLEWSLIKMGPLAIEPVQQAYEDLDLAARKVACGALGQIADESALPILLGALKDAEEVRTAALRGLAFIDNEQAAAALIEHFRTDEGSGSPAAADALGELLRNHRRLVAPHLQSLYESESPELRAKLVSLVATSGSAEDKDIVEAALADVDAKVRSTAIGAVVELGVEGMIDKLVSALDDHHREVKLAAATALGRAGDSRALDPLKKLLKNDDPWLRMMALRGVVKLSDKEGFTYLVNALNDSAPLVVLATIELLKAIDRQEATDELSKALFHRDIDVVIAALEALRERQSDTTEAALLNVLSHPEPLARIKAAQILSGYSSPRVGTAFAEQLAIERESEVRNVLEEILNRPLQDDSRTKLS